MTTTAEPVQIIPVKDVIFQIPGYDPLRDLQPGMWFDDRAAEYACRFFPTCLTHVKGPLAKMPGKTHGYPLEIEPWFQAVVANIFGWKKENGFRRFQEVWIYVPRKNSKTTYTAGLANLIFFTDGEGGAEIFMGAGEKEQASIVFNIAKTQAMRDSELSKHAKFFKYSVTNFDGTCS